MNLKDTIRSVPDFPKKGILFRDITTLVKDPEALRCLIDTFADELKEKKIDMVVGPEARGFVLGSALAYALGAGFVLARKPGKLPCETLRYEYSSSTARMRLKSMPERSAPGCAASSWMTCLQRAARRLQRQS